jgi:hypothetical protein
MYNTILSDVFIYVSKKKILNNLKCVSRHYYEQLKDNKYITYYHVLIPQNRLFLDIVNTQKYILKVLIIYKTSFSIELPNLLNCVKLVLVKTNVSKFGLLPNCRTLILSHINLNEELFLPKCEVFHCKFGNIFKLPLIYNCIEFNCFMSNILHLPYIPNCRTLNCSSSLISYIPQYLMYLRVLKCNDTNITILPKLPSCLNVYCKNTHIKDINRSCLNAKIIL